MMIALVAALSSPPPRPVVTVKQTETAIVCEPRLRPRGAVMVGLRMPARLQEHAGADIILLTASATFYRGEEEVARGVQALGDVVKGGEAVDLKLKHDITMPSDEQARKWDSFRYGITYAMTERQSRFTASLDPPFDLAIRLPLRCED